MPHTKLDRATLARFFDHTILKPDATVADVERICDEALAHEFFAVCVNGAHVPRVARRLGGSRVATCSVIGFPLGAMSTVAKVAETEAAIASGAREIDMVLPIGALKEGDDRFVESDIAAVKRACGEVLLKVIFENCLLTEVEIDRACALAMAAGADFVKTSTGFGISGAKVADVARMRRAVGEGLGVKASGGIRTLEGALAMIAAGATRLGASAGVTILAECD
jgi:deoxyribose-phosphate aldolase